MENLANKDKTNIISGIQDNDRISKFLTPFLSDMIFDELSIDYLKRTNTEDFMTGVPIPIGDSFGKKEIDTREIALNMGLIIGADPRFPYQEQYIKFLNKVFDNNAHKVLISQGARCGEESDFEKACCYERAALLIEPKSKDALYLYARACLDAYQMEGKSEEYTGMFKAESLEMFELLTMLYPDFEQGFYYLGYGYANLGLYLKAKLTWEEFINLTKGSSNRDRIKQVTEISERVMQLQDPVKIEHAINEILRGNYVYGRNELIKYKEGSYNNWWPLWYYLGMAESSLANYEAAIDNYKMALRYSPSNTDVMKDLIELYNATGDSSSADKYRKKIKIIQENRAAELSEIN